MKRVYVIASSVGLVKLGISANPDQRKRQLELSSGLSLRVHHETPLMPLAADIEKIAHSMLAECRREGEWFCTTPEHLVVAIDEASKAVETKSGPLVRFSGLVTIQVKMPNERLIALEEIAGRELRTLPNLIDQVIAQFLRSYAAARDAERDAERDEETVEAMEMLGQDYAL